MGSGCIYDDEPMPEIVHTPASSKPIIAESHDVGRQQQPRDDYGNLPSNWLPPSLLEKDWTAIVIHHSGTETGNAAIFDRWHREGNHWEGVGYDFVIGNGTNSADGEVEVTFRWREQKMGAHCGTPDNWANEDAVGICLVGNFNHTVPTTRQLRSLLKLTVFLQRRYEIPTGRIYGHKTTPGARDTECPGRNFPMETFKSMLGD